MLEKHIQNSIHIYLHLFYTRCHTQETKQLYFLYIQATWLLHTGVVTYSYGCSYLCLNNMELWTHVKLDSVHVIVMINVTNLHLYIYIETVTKVVCMVHVVM